MLGLRLVKKTVNQDDPTVYHLFYADEHGNAGSDITFFEYPGRARGRAGAGMVHRVVWRVALRGVARLLGERRGVGVATRTDGALRFADPEGLELELVVDESGDEPLVGASTPRSRPSTRSRASTACARSAAIRERSRALLERRSASSPADGRAWRGTRRARGGTRTTTPPPAERGVPGRRHGAPRRVGVADGRARGVARARRRGGRAPTPVIDRFYFRSIYFREPSGVLFEIATIGPGFTADEPLETLGERLSLPPDFEHLREQVEPVLTPIRNPRETWPRDLLRQRGSATGEPEGALVLFHGRGADEHDLAPLLDVLDPERRLARRSRRADRSRSRPAARTGTRYARSATPTPRRSTRRTRGERVARRLSSSDPPERTVLGGFSQGAVMSYALGARRRPPAPGRGARAQRVRPDRRRLRARPRPAAPARSQSGTARYDPVIGVEWGRRAKARSRRPAPTCSTASTRSRTRSTRASCSRPATTSSIGFEQRVHDVVARGAVLLDPRPEHTLAPEAGLLGDALRREVLDVGVELEPPVAVRERPPGDERERA